MNLLQSLSSSPTAQERKELGLPGGSSGVTGHCPPRKCRFPVTIRGPQITLPTTAELPDLTGHRGLARIGTHWAPSASLFPCLHPQCLSRHISSASRIIASVLGVQGGTVIITSRGSPQTRSQEESDGASLAPQS